MRVCLCVVGAQKIVFVRRRAGKEYRPPIHPEHGYELMTQEEWHRFSGPENPNERRLVPTVAIGLTGLAERAKSLLRAHGTLRASSQVSVFLFGFICQLFRSKRCVSQGMPPFFFCLSNDGRAC